MRQGHPLPLTTYPLDPALAKGGEQKTGNEKQ